MQNFSIIGYLWSLDPPTWPEGWVSFWAVSPPFSIFDPSNFFLSAKRIIIFSLSFVTSEESQAMLLVIYADRIKIVHRFLLQNGVWKVLWIWALNIICKHIYLIKVIQKFSKKLHFDFKMMWTFKLGSSGLSRLSVSDHFLLYQGDIFSKILYPNFQD